MKKGWHHISSDAAPTGSLKSLKVCDFEGRENQGLERISLRVFVSFVSFRVSNYAIVGSLNLTDLGLESP